jgi:hypothetical protein
MRNAYKVLVGKSEVKRSHRRFRRSWGDNIRMYLREIGYEDVERICLAQDKDQWRVLFNTVMNLTIP